ncbi:hypothetical protein DFH06DRAFT_1290862 [Mycena polygramma]|nr:hypothetical protein DFH06DRAFT_1290862 [Mycena polygramma]
MVQRETHFNNTAHARIWRLHTPWTLRLQHCQRCQQLLRRSLAQTPQRFVDARSKSFSPYRAPVFVQGNINIHPMFSQPTAPIAASAGATLTSTPPPQSTVSSANGRDPRQLPHEGRGFAIEDDARVRMVLGTVARRLTQETQPPGELSVRKHLLEQTVNACLDDYERFSAAPEESHELLAVAGRIVVAQAAEYILRRDVVVLPNDMSPLQNVNTEDLVETTKDAIAEAVKESRGAFKIDELFHSLAC